MTTLVKSMKRELERTIRAVGLVLVALLSPVAVAPAAAEDAASVRVVYPTDRTVLPIPEPVNPPITVLDARNATPPPRFQVKAPQNAPNVLIVLIDDMGFGQSSAFGGPIHMPGRREDGCIGTDRKDPVLLLLGR